MSKIVVFWQRNQDLNPDEQSQSLLCYRYTIPLDIKLEFFTRFAVANEQSLPLGVRWC